MDAVTFGRWLRQVMQDSGVSRTELIERLSGPGVGQHQRQNVYAWLGGSTVPSWDSCQRLAGALNVDPDVVLVAAGHLDEAEAAARAANGGHHAGGMPEARQWSYEGGANGLNAQEVVAIRALLARVLTPEEHAEVRRLLDLLAEVDEADVACLLALGDAARVQRSRRRRREGDE